MTPAQLQPESFRGYPPEARQLATRHIEVLRRLPLAFAPLLLREVIAYDWKFPVERRELAHQFVYLSANPQALGSFAQLRITPDLERVDWVNTPALFSEQLTAHLWATHQIDTFRAAAVTYVDKLNASAPPQPLPMPRLSIVVIGQGVSTNNYPLFRKLRPHGAYFTRVQPEDAYRAIVETVAARAERRPEAHEHWYIDGAVAAQTGIGITSVSYAGLTPVRAKLQAKIQKSFESGVGSEALRTLLAQMQPRDIGLDEKPDGALSHFQLSLFTESSGTQIYSTTFVQWAAREALRRAQPLTLLARFAPRQREANMQELLTEAKRSPSLDPAGSLIDADMGAYYTWLNQQRLSGSEQSRFVAWFENHNEAVVIAPGFQKNTVNAAQTTMRDLLSQVS
jgi:hypothetical protein